MVLSARAFSRLEPPTALLALMKSSTSSWVISLARRPSEERHGGAPRSTSRALRVLVLLIASVFLLFLTLSLIRGRGRRHTSARPQCRVERQISFWIPSIDHHLAVRDPEFSLFLTLSRQLITQPDRQGRQITIESRHDQLSPSRHASHRPSVESPRKECGSDRCAYLRPCKLGNHVRSIPTAG